MESGGGMSMELTYEPARPEDIDAVFAFCKELIDAYEDVARIDYDEVLSWVRRKLAKRIGDYTRVLADGQLAGYYSFAPSGEKMELDDLYVLPAFRGRGIGTAVVERCCAQTGLPVFLYVFRRNARAVALYERLGFRVVEEVEETRLIMQRG